MFPPPADARLDEDKGKRGENDLMSVCSCVSGCWEVMIRVLSDVLNFFFSYYFLPLHLYQRIHNEYMIITCVFVVKS